MPIQEIAWSQQAPLPLLLLLQLVPLVTAVIIHVGKRHTLLLAITALVVELVLTATLFNRFDLHSASIQFGEQWTFLGPFAYHAAVNGIALLFILLTTVLGLVVLVYGWEVLPSSDHTRFMSLVLLTIATLMSLYTTQDLLWFLLMSSLQLIPIAGLLIHWSTSAEKELALARFIQFMVIGLLLFAAGTFMLGWLYAEQQGVWSFNIHDLSVLQIDNTISSLLFFLLFYGLAVRIPLFPLHGWLPLVAEHGTVAVAPVFLLGLKVGLFAMIQFILPIMEPAVTQWAPYIVGFAVAGIFYAALLAMLQSNMRRLIAYAVISHSGIVVIGLFSLNHNAFAGSILLTFNFGLAISTLLLMNGIIFYRTRSLLFHNLGGLFDKFPMIGIAFFIGGLAIVGMPGTPGFDAVHLVLEAAMAHYGALMTITAALGNVVAAGFLLWSFQRTFMAKPQEAQRARVEGMKPATRVERLLALSLIIMLLLSGFFSEPLLDLTAQSFSHLEAIYSHGGVH